MAEIQVIMKDGEPEYAILKWDDYQALKKQTRDVPLSPPVNESQVSSEIVEAQGQSDVDERQLSLVPSFDEECDEIDIYKARTEKGWSIDHLAREAGISPSYLKQVESGARQLSSANLRSLYRALNLNF